MAEPSQAALNLSADERRLYGQLFQEADTDKLGIVTGEVAVKFFGRSKLDGAILGEIWQIADVENRGFLTPPGFSIALRLIGHCQAGRTPSSDLATKPGPLPKLDGTTAAPATAPAQNARPSTPTGPIAAQTTGPIRVPPLTPDKISGYQRLFERAGTRQGYLAGDTARQMFEKAGLPNEVLGQIWGLADIESRGALNLTEFIIAMHLLDSMRNGSLRAIPQTLPSGLLEAASRKVPSNGAPPTAIPRQFTGPTVPRPQSPLSRPPQTPPVASQPLATQANGNDWLVTPQDKTKFDSIFSSLDTAGHGYITGDQAVQFFSNSGLPEDTLASIWDLADIRSEGQLNKDEFAVAMYLIKQQRGKTDRDSLPTTLPPRLIPPTMRQRVIPPSQPTAPAFDNASFANPQQPKSASDDLFGLDALAGGSPPPLQPQQQPPPVAAASPVIAAAGFGSSAQASPIAQQTAFKPFVPSSTFGQGIAAQHTGGSVQSNTTQSRGFQPQKALAGDDLLGDTDPETSRKLTNDTTELANMSNQIGILRNNMQDVQTKKSNTEREISSTSAQKRELEGRLGMIRSQYEQEVRDVKSLEERLNASRAETKRLQQDLAMIQGSHADLQTQHHTVGTALEADQRENAGLKQQIAGLNTEVAQLKTQLEKMQSDARQQKGMVAINKKQLATVEAQREKIRQDMAALEQERLEGERLERERVEQERQARIEQERLDQERAEQLRLERERLERVRLEKEQQKRERMQREQAEQAERAQLERQRLQQEEEDRIEAQRIEAQRVAASQQKAREATPSHVSPAMSPSTNPFHRGGTMSPSVFSQSHQTTDFDSFFGPDESAVSAPHAVSSIFHPQETAREVSRAETSTPSIAEPPPPPPSQQLSSSALPFRANLPRSDSFDSSVRANPPASRSGMSEIGTPAQFPGSPTMSVDGGLDHNVERERDTGTMPSPGPSYAQPVPISHQSRPEPSRLTSSIPGAFPDDTRASTPTAASTMSESFTDAGSDPFGSKADQSTIGNLGAPGFTDNSPAAQAMDRVGHAAGGPSRPNTEFPPIQELEADDSESEDEEAYDTAAKPDGHAPATILNDSERAEAQHAPASTVIDEPSVQPAVAEIGTDDIRAEAPPPLEAQNSPPTYDETHPSSPPGQRDTNEFPREYSGLLPSREIVTSPVAEPVQQTPQSIATSPQEYAAPVSTSSAMGASREIPHDSAHAVPFAATNGLPHVVPSGAATSQGLASQAPVDDFDAAFDDLDEAKEEDEHGDSFMGNESRGAEFDPVFDAPSRVDTDMSSNYGRAAASSSTSGFGNDFNASSSANTGAYQPSLPWLNSNSATTSGTANNFSGFPPSFTGTSTSTQAPTQASTSNTDWDSMFAGFDNAPSAKAATQPLAQPKASAFGFDDDEITSASSQPPPRVSSAVASPPPASKPAPQRPATIGRALTTTGEHDDPFLKSLTGMGFKREDALAALEKYDYNLDAATDYLTRKRR